MAPVSGFEKDDLPAMQMSRQDQVHIRKTRRIQPFRIMYENDIFLPRNPLQPNSVLPRSDVIKKTAFGPVAETLFFNTGCTLDIQKELGGLFSVKSVVVAPDKDHCYTGRNSYKEIPEISRTHRKIIVVSGKGYKIGVI